jgi:hypothetical protein
MANDAKEKLCNKLLTRMYKLEDEKRAIEKRILDLNETYLDVVNGWIEPEGKEESDESSDYRNDL